MAVTAKVFGAAILGQYSTTAARRIDWVGDTIKVTLHTVSYVPDQDTHDFADDLTNELATAGGYTAGGLTLTGKSTAYDATTNRVRCFAADSVWTTATFGPFQIAVVRKDTGSAATSPLLSWVDFGAATSVANGTFTIDWDGTDGVFYHAVT